MKNSQKCYLLCYWASLLVGLERGASFSLLATRKSLLHRRRGHHSRGPSSSSALLGMVSSTTNPKASDSNLLKRGSKSSNGAAVTKLPEANVKYPTARGSTTDARKIIATRAGRQHLEAVRLSHILFCSRDLAVETLDVLRKGQQSFEELAPLVSACEKTKNHGGAIGWVQVNEKPKAMMVTVNSTHSSTEASMESTQPLGVNSHLDDVLPRSAREQIIQISTKPGDVFMVESPRGFHLVQVVDVMQNVRQMATTRPNNKKSRRENDTNGRQKYYKIETMGCQMNQADSERIEGQLQSLGLRPIHESNEDEQVQQHQDPDVIVLNTCSIRDHAEQKVYSYIGPHAKRKRNGEDVTIVVAGCVAQQTGENLLRRAPEVDLVMGPQYANRLADLLEDVHNGNQVVATEAVHIMEDSTKPRRSSTVAAWVNVIYGCNEQCTFCIVPTTRGVEQSRPVESIVQEVTDLVRDGYQEVTLLGQNIDAYGRDMVPKRKFSDLIRIVGNITGLQRLRFVTSHPRYMSMGVVEAVADTPTACESFHIPFQSGSNDVLSAMGRGHTREKYLHIVNRIRSRIPDASITADVIVGFPGETEAQFQETLSLMEEVVFDSVNTAAYSPRPNTPAAIWDNQVDDDVKQDRLQRINELNKRHATQRRARMMGRVEEILIEERNVRVPTQVMGRTRHGYIVYCEGDIDVLRGQLVKVKIDTCQTYYLAGKIVQDD